MHRYVLVITLVLLVAVPAAAFDWMVLATESLARTDLWQTEEWYSATPDRPRYVSNGDEEWFIYEINPLYAGRPWQHVEIGLRSESVLYTMLPAPYDTLAAALYVFSRSSIVANNNNLLRDAGLGERWILAYRFEW